MSRNLTPHFIVEQCLQNRTRGELDALCLFVDISGFTQLTVELMKHGKVGAEVLAETLMAIFEPLVQSVYSHKGFIASFAGDAFTAIFPCLEGMTNAHALDAAWKIQQHMLHNPVQETPYGRFEFTVKSSLSTGRVHWTILPHKIEWADSRLDQSHVYLFTGPGIDRCMAGEALAESGHIIVHRDVMVPLHPDQFQTASILDAEAAGEYVQLVYCGLDTPNPSVVHNALPSISNTAIRFFPEELITLSLQGEFRDVTTIFVNFGRSPSAEPGLMQTLLKLLHQYDGYLCRIDQKSAQDRGGTALIFFGAPRSHENDVARALGFLLDLTTQAPIPLRAGVSYGTAYAGFIGSNLREEYTCYSARVNLAVRQMSKAPWGEIWLDEAVAKQAEEAFVCKNLGKMDFKGFAEPCPVYRLLDRRMISPEYFYPRPLVGRQRELEQLWQVMQPVLDGRFGGVVIIEGEAGIGKSRLVHEFQERLHHPIIWFLCQSDEILRQPLNPFRYWLRHYFNQLSSNDEQANKRAFDTKIDTLIDALNSTALDADPRISNLITELDRTRSFLGSLVNLHWAESLYEQVEPELRQQNTLDALKTLIKAESLCQPVVLHLEDVHWLDVESQAFVEKLTRNVEGFPFLLLITTRPVAEADDVELGGIKLGDAEIPQQTIHLSALNEDDLTALVQRQLHGSASPELLTLLRERTQGNPFFAEQIVLYLQARNLLTEGKRGWQLNATDRTSTRSDPALPTDVRTVLTARLDQLEPPVREVVQTAAVLGREFDFQVLAQMLDQDVTLSDKMVMADQAAVWSAMTQARYLFRHALLRDAAYEMQLRARLRRQHRRAGAAIEQVYARELAPHYAELVHHYGQGGATEQECHYAGLAGNYAVEQYANDAAARYFTRALELTPGDNVSARYDFLLARQKANAWQGKRQAQKTDLETLSMLTASDMHPAQRATVQLELADYARFESNYATALTHVEAAEECALATQDTDLQTKSSHQWGRILWQAGDHDAARVKLQHARTLAQTAGNRQEEARCLCDIGTIDLFQGHYKAASTLYEQAQAIYQTLNYRYGEVNCLAAFSSIDEQMGNYLRAREFCEQALDLCSTIGLNSGRRYFLLYLGNIYVGLGGYELAKEYYTQAIELCEELGNLNEKSSSLSNLGLVDHILNKNVQAKRYISEALSIQRHTGARHLAAYSLTYLGDVCLALGDLAQARTAHQEALELRRELKEEGLAIDNLAGLVRISLQAGDSTKAGAQVDEILDWLNRHGIGGIEFPILVYLTCYRALTATVSISRSNRRRARAVLEAGHTLLQERATKIQDDTLRHSFLENVPFNRELATLYASLPQSTS